MHTPTSVRATIQTLRDHSYTIICFGLFTVFALLASFSVLSAFGFQRVAYTYSERTACVTSPKFLPQLFRSDTKNGYRVDRTTSFSVFGQPIYSHALCATPTEAPKAESEHYLRESLFGVTAIGKPIHVESASYTKIRATTPTDKAVPVDKPLRFKLDKPDAAFIYTVQANEKSGPCIYKSLELSCDLSRLSLEHAKKYELRIVRTFNGKNAGQALAHKTETLTPISIVMSSVAGGSTVYEQPTEFTFQTDKPIRESGTLRLSAKDAAGTETPLKAKISVNDKIITAKLDQPLPRKQTVSIDLQKLRASDGSGLAAPYTLAFVTSGGPTVKGTNIGKSTVTTSQTVMVNLDQPVAASQNWPALVSLSVNGQPVSTKVTAQNNKLIIDPVSDFPACGKLVLKFTADIQSTHGVSGDSAWTFNSRARCAVIGSIGTSAGGRAITYYRFGSGSNPIVYIGAIHGNEASSKTLMDNWINEIEANADNIPAGRSIVVIPVTNPDGFAVNSRLNKNGVDLNRNFPSNDWKATVTIPGGRTLPAGGGATSLSEPEAQALASFVQRERPRILLTYHAKASIIEANEAGSSMSAAYLYAKTSRYRAVGKSQNSSFQHDTTGALEDWMRDKLGMPALCIELAAQTGNEFSRNKAALWAMTGL